MANLRSISELTSLIQSHTASIEEAVKGSPAAELSLALGSPPFYQLPASLEASRDELLEAIDELRARILGPLGYFTMLALPISSLTAILQTIYAFDIPAHVPLTPTGSISYKELASHCGLPEDDTRRILEAAIAFRIFEQAGSGLVRHNAVSASIAAVPGMRDYLGMFIEDTVIGAGKFAESLKRFPNSGEPGHSSSMLVARLEATREEVWKQDFDPSKSFFDFIANDKQRVARFAKAMGLSQNAPGFSTSHFVNNLPWTETEKCPTKIVDIGGSNGVLCETLLREYPGVKQAVVLDLPEVVNSASIPDDLKGRLEFESYNFLTEEVSQQADAYVFRHIFHDWSDQYAARILKNLVPALRPGNRLWLSEAVLTELDERNHVKNQTSRAADLLMKIGFNGKERTRAGWEMLFKDADPRLRILSVICPHGSADSVIEVVFDG